jgi:hypothetical protein
MYIKSGLGTIITILLALICSRTVLLSFDDPEGPNLLVVIALGLFIYLISRSVFLFPSFKNLIQGQGVVRVGLLTLAQVIVSVVLYWIFK